MSEEIVWYDDVFQVSEQHKLWISQDKEGNNLVTSNDKQMCIDMTRFYLKGKQEGFIDSRTLNDGKVGGKL